MRVELVHVGQLASVLLGVGGVILRVVVDGGITICLLFGDVGFLPFFRFIMSE